MYDGEIAFDDNGDLWAPDDGEASIVDGAEVASPDLLTGRLDRTWQIMQVSHAGFLQALVEYDERKLYSADGCRSMANWLVQRYELAHREAEAWVRTARALRRLPAISAAFEEGRLSFDQLKPLARFATPETDEELAREAPGWSVAHIESLARQARPVTAPEEKSDRDKRHFNAWFDERVLRFRGALPDTDGQTLLSALDNIARKAPVNPDTGAFDPYPVRMADALASMASASLGADAPSNADRATIVVHADADVLFGDSEGNADVEGGLVVGERTLRRLACDCRWQLIADGPDGQAVGVGRTQRSVPPWLDRLLRRRDPTCRWPGCRADAWLDDHHLIHWVDGGPTDPDNLMRTCRYHHRLLHEGEWRVEGDPNSEIRFISPLGRVLRTRSAPLDPDLLERLIRRRRRRRPPDGQAEDPWSGGGPGRPRTDRSPPDG